MKMCFVSKSVFRRLVMVLYNISNTQSAKNLSINCTKCLVDKQSNMHITSSFDFKKIINQPKANIETI